MTEEKILPEIGQYVRSHGKLVDIEEVAPETPPQPDIDYIFEDTEARCELWRNGEMVVGLGGYTDFYGEKTSVSTAIKEMKEYAKERGIDPESEVEVIVIEVVSRVRHRPNEGESFYDKRFVNFSPRRHGCLVGMPDPVETKVWSSRDKP